MWGEPGENRGGTGGETGENRGRPKEPGENRGHLGREPGENRGLLVFIYKEYRGRSGGFGTRTGGEPGGGNFLWNKRPNSGPENQRTGPPVIISTLGPKLPSRKGGSLCTYLLGQKSCRTKVSRIFRIFVPGLAPNFAPNFPRICRGLFVLCFVGNGDQKKFTRNPRHFSMQNSQANTKRKYSQNFFWRAGLCTYLRLEFFCLHQEWPRQTMGEIHELFVLALSLVWFAGASFFCLQLSFFTYSPLRCLWDAISHCKQTSLQL